MKRNILFMTLASFVFMVAAATAALSIERTPIDPGNVSSEGLAPLYDSVFTAEDYIVDTEGVATYADSLLPDQAFLVKRTSELKSTVFTPPGSTSLYTKVVYAVNLKLRDLSLFTDGVAGLVVSDLTVTGFGEKKPCLVSASLTINGSAVLLEDGGELEASNYLTWTYDAGTGTVSARLILPSLDLTTALAYNDKDAVSVFVMFKVPETGLAIGGSDIGFPDFQ